MIFVLAFAFFFASNMTCYAILSRFRVLSCVPALLLCIPFLIDIVLSCWSPAPPFITSAPYWLWFVFAASVTSIVVHGALLVGSSRTNAANGLSSLLASLLLSFYFVETTINHAVFASREHNSTSVNLSALLLRSALVDVRCDADRILISLQKDSPLLYRCPTVSMLGVASQQPFFPWPDYVEGETGDLLKLLGFLKHHHRNSKERRERIRMEDSAC